MQDCKFNLVLEFFAGKQPRQDAIFLEAGQILKGQN